MTSLTTPQAALGLLHRSIVKTVYRVLSWKSRRMIFLSTIYGMATDLQQPDEARIFQLTRALNLARNPETLQLPLAIKSVVWYKRLPSGLEVEGQNFQVSDMTRTDLTEDTQEALLNELLQKTPSWLLYARPGQMRYDLECMFKFLRGPETA